VWSGVRRPLARQFHRCSHIPAFTIGNAVPTLETNQGSSTNAPHARRCAGLSSRLASHQVLIQRRKRPFDGGVVRIRERRPRLCLLCDCPRMSRFASELNLKSQCALWYREHRDSPMYIGVLHTHIRQQQVPNSCARIEGAASARRESCRTLPFGSRRILLTGPMFTIA
jgi:hypothetical protein